MNYMNLAFGMPGFYEWIIISLLMALMGFWLWMLIDCLMNETDSTNKLVWTLIILFTNGLGAVLYFFIRYLRRRAEQGAAANP